MALEEDTVGQAAPGPGREALRCGEAHWPGPREKSSPMRKAQNSYRFPNHFHGSPEACDHGRPELTLVCACEHTHTLTHAQAHVRLFFSQFSQT